MIFPLLILFPSLFSVRFFKQYHSFFLSLMSYLVIFLSYTNYIYSIIIMSLLHHITPLLLHFFFSYIPPPFLLYSSCSTFLPYSFVIHFLLQFHFHHYITITLYYIIITTYIYCIIFYICLKLIIC